MGHLCAGEWHARTLEKEKDRLQMEKVMLLPIIIFIDETIADKLGKSGVTPILMTLGILTIEAMYKDASKGLLGYLPDVKAPKDVDDKAFKAFKKKLDSDCLDVIMEQIKVSPRNTSLGGGKYCGSYDVCCDPTGPL